MIIGDQALSIHAESFNDSSSLVYEVFVYPPWQYINTGFQVRVWNAGEKRNFADHFAIKFEY